MVGVLMGKWEPGGKGETGKGPGRGCTSNPGTKLFEECKNNFIIGKVLTGDALVRTTSLPISVEDGDSSTCSPHYHKMGDKKSR